MLSQEFFQTFQVLKLKKKTHNWEKENPELEGKLKQLVSEHLYFLSEIFSLYFPESLTDECKQYKWILNSFHFKNYEDYKLDETNKDLLIDFCIDVKVLPGHLAALDPFSFLWLGYAHHRRSIIKFIKRVIKI